MGRQEIELMTTLTVRVPSNIQLDQLAGCSIVYDGQEAIVSSNTAPVVSGAGYVCSLTLDRDWTGNFQNVEFEPQANTILYKIVDFDDSLGVKDELGPFDRLPSNKAINLKRGLISSCDLYYSVSPDQDKLLLHPIPDVDKKVRMSFSSSGTKFGESTNINIPAELEDRFISACSDYVRSRIAKDIDRNAGLAGVNFSEFKRQLRSIFKQLPR